MRTSVRRRISYSFLLLACMVSSVFGLTAYLSVEFIEDQVLYARLDRTAERLIEQYRASGPVRAPADIGFFVDDAIPAELRDLAPGAHEAEVDGTLVLAAVHREDDHRFVVTEELAEFDHMETVIFLALGAGFLSSLALASLLGRVTARHIVASLEALAAAVARPDGKALPGIEAQDEIGVLARALAARTEELQHYLQRERLFTGDVNHELRTPLTVMQGAAELLKVQLADRPPQMAVAERIRRVAADSAQRVSALLLLSRAPGRLDAPETALRPVIEAELERCRPLLHGKPVQCLFDCEQDVRVHARAELAGIAIGNLLRNACMHTERGTVRVHLGVDSVTVEDDGPGLPKAVSARLFERFVQGNPEAPEGTGLGLSIVKRVAEHLGWEVRAETPQGGGTRFVLAFRAESRN